MQNGYTIVKSRRVLRGISTEVVSIMDTTCFYPLNSSSERSNKIKQRVKAMSYRITNVDGTKKSVWFTKAIRLQATYLYKCIIASINAKIQTIVGVLRSLHGRKPKKKTTLVKR